MAEHDLDGLRGTQIVATSYRTVWSAITDVVDALGVDDAARLKIASGEHLAAVLITAFLGVPPTSADVDGGPDLVFDLTSSRDFLLPLTGRGDVQFADFEVKSLPGPARKYSAGIDRALARGQQPRDTEINAKVTSAIEVMNAARDMISKAADQLARKSSPQRARNIFLVSHPFDHMYAEITDTFVVHRLAPLIELPDTVDAVWLLAFPVHLVVWSVAEQRWTSLYFAHTEPGEDLPGTEDELDFLVAVDIEFRGQLGTKVPSPYAFKLVAENESHGGRQ